MKITKEALKKLIKEELEEVAPAPPAPEAAGMEQVAQLKKELVDMSLNLGGITTAELPHIKVALDLIKLAKSEPIENATMLKTHLLLVADDLASMSKK